MKLIIEKSVPGRRGVNLPILDVPKVRMDDLVPAGLIREEIAALPEVAEIDVVRHYTELSRRNYGIDNGFYPLGSCTMKYNPKVNEKLARQEVFTNLHPLLIEEYVQGALKLLYNMDTYLCELTGMAGFTFQPLAGAHGELASMMMIKAYHHWKGQNREKLLVPDSSHGTNPASAALCGYQVEVVPSDSNGECDIGKLKEMVNEDVAGLMLTNPNTLGLFERRIMEIASIIHHAGGLLYYDGANFNPLLGYCRPGDMGFDLIHLNLHKTFSTPHGGGGPGAGPVGVSEKLLPFLPVPVVIKKGSQFLWDNQRPLSVGRVSGFYGNFLVILRAYAYVRSLGACGLRQVAEDAVLNANYLLVRLKKLFTIPYNHSCMHEFVLSTDRFLDKGIGAMHIAKRLLDYGFHPPTVYFPIIVRESMMIEPTETESKQTLDTFVQAMEDIVKEIETNPEIVLTAPHSTVVSRLDETLAARCPQVTAKI